MNIKNTLYVIELDGLYLGVIQLCRNRFLSHPYPRFKVVWILERKLVVCLKLG